MERGACGHVEVLGLETLRMPQSFSVRRDEVGHDVLGNGTAQILGNVSPS
jgi:hypothetical protein